MRRITVTRAEGGELVLITTLSDPEQFPADDLLEVYLKRWSIENMFQQVTEVFHLQDLIGSTPSATVFQAAFCFLLPASSLGTSNGIRYELRPHRNELRPDRLRLEATSA